jgi:hypothetical protein
MDAAATVQEVVAPVDGEIDGGGVDGEFVRRGDGDEELASVGIILGARDDWDKIEKPGLKKGQIEMRSKTRKVLCVCMCVCVCVCV